MRAYEHTPLPDIQAWSGFGAEKTFFENILAIEDHIPGEKLQSRQRLAAQGIPGVRAGRFSSYRPRLRRLTPLVASGPDTGPSTTTRRRE
jgi:hypothetical protein